jgi:hypothetical protein
MHFAPDGTKQATFMEPGFAHTLGCQLIEVALIGHDSEESLKAHPGQVLDPTENVLEFGTRLEQRMKLNDSTATVTWGTGKIQ